MDTVLENSTDDTRHDPHMVMFAMACPNLLKSHEVENPFRAVIDFFNFTSPAGYRRRLTSWYHNASCEGMMYKPASDLLFLHNQFSRLLNATFLIASKKLTFKPEFHTNKHPTFGHWLVEICDTIDCEVQLLEYTHWENPLAFIWETFNYDAMASARFGLNEWLETGCSENASFSDLDLEYRFELYELLQRTTEAFYLILIAPVKEK